MLLRSDTFLSTQPGGEQETTAKIEQKFPPARYGYSGEEWLERGSLRRRGVLATSKLAPRGRHIIEVHPRPFFSCIAKRWPRCAQCLRPRKIILFSASRTLK